MANLGAISQGSTSIFQERILPFWRGYGSTKQMSSIDMTDSITVTVLLDSVPQASKVVLLYYRRNGNLIKKKLTDSNGQVVFTGLDANDVGGYFAVALHTSSLNAIIYDKL